jgi:peptide/nickel transport system permease protein
MTTTVTPPSAAAATTTPRRAARRRTTGRARAVLGCLPALVVLALTVLGPALAPYPAEEVVGTPNLPPGATYWFGTDPSGMDVFSRTLTGFSYDVLIGLGVTALATVVGIAVGLGVGMFEGRGGLSGLLARTASRALDLLQAIPAIVLALGLVSFFGATVVVLVVSISVVLLPSQARVVRSETLRVRGEAYVEAARISGFSEPRLIVRHVLPNVSWPALENTTLQFGSAIFVVAALGFLGIGLPVPTPEWGSMISVGAPAAAVGRWWPALFPAAALALTVVCFAVLGHRLFSGRRTR